MMKLIVGIDLQNDFIDGILGSEQAQVVSNKIVDYINTIETDNTYFVFTRDTHYRDSFPNTVEGKLLPLHTEYGAHGWMVADAIAEAVRCRFGSDCVSYYDKQIFGSLELATDVYDWTFERSDEMSFSDWKTYNYDPGLEVHIFGFCTDICVISNALMLKAALPLNTRVICHADLCAGVSLEKHEAALEVMRSCQIEVI